MNKNFKIMVFIGILLPGYVYPMEQNKNASRESRLIIKLRNEIGKSKNRNYDLTEDDIYKMVTEYQKQHPKEFDYEKTKEKILKHQNNHYACTDLLVCKQMDIDTLQVLIKKYECENNPEMANALAKHISFYRSSYKMIYNNSLYY